MLIRTALVGSACIVLAGCFTGQRPTLTTAPPGGNSGSPVGDASADAVLSLLDGPSTEASTATYSILHKLGGQTATATVARDASGRRSVTIGDVRYLPGLAKTCTLSTNQCVNGIVEQRTSDLGVQSTFADVSPDRRLRVSVRRKTSDTTASTKDVADQSATCVSVPVGNGTEVYCAIAGGHLAYLDLADLHIELTELTATADPAVFVAPS